MNGTSQLINSTNLASVLGVSNATVGAWIKAGKIFPEKKDSTYSYFDSKKLPFPELKMIDPFSHSG